MKLGLIVVIIAAICGLATSVLQAQDCSGSGCGSYMTCDEHDACNRFSTCAHVWCLDTSQCGANTNFYQCNYFGCSFANSCN
jgi:hypothetical protein